MITRPARSLSLFLLLLFIAACGTPQVAEPMGVFSESISSPPASPSRSPGASPTPAAASTAMPAATPTEEPEATAVHAAEGAGRWYPADPQRLRAGIDVYLGPTGAPADNLAGGLLAVIVPHAGYVYSGPVAGHAYRALQQAGCEGHTIAVIGDTHTGNGSAPIAVWVEGAFETPLGSLPVDAEVAAALVDADPRIEPDQVAFRQEHPVENQLPFIQVVCPEAKIVPIVMRQPSEENAQVLSEALVEAFGQRPALIVASTDLSHYHPYDEARSMDKVALEAIESMDPGVVAGSTQRCADLGLGGGDPMTMCSQGAVMAALEAAARMGADRATVLDYATSGDVPLGDRSQVVGYAAIALWDAAGDGPEPGARSDLDLPGFEVASLPSPPVEPLSVSPQRQQELLRLARETVTSFLTAEAFPPFETDEPELLQPLGAYVTYEKDGVLRGCLGRIEADRPAYLNVQYAAVAAALADPRFPAVGLEELGELTLEVSLLQPLEEVDRPDQIQIGRDGILMRVGEDKGALYLPQVAPEQGWDLDETLLNLCLKAGLAGDCWTGPDARFHTFAGQWFGEER